MLELIDQIMDRRLLMNEIAWDIISFESFFECGSVILPSKVSLDSSLMKDLLSRDNQTLRRL